MKVGKSTIAMGYRALDLLNISVKSLIACSHLYRLRTDLLMQDWMPSVAKVNQSSTYHSLRESRGHDLLECTVQVGVIPLIP